MSDNKRKVSWRTARGRSSRDDILDVAGQIMSSQGYEGTSIAALSQATGLNVSSIYWHFGSKAGLLAALMERGAQRFFDHHEEVLAKAPRHRSALARLRWVLARTGETVALHREFLRILITLVVTERDSESHAVVQRVRALGRESVRRQIELAFLTDGEAMTPAEARRASEQWASFALALVDGTVLAREADPETSFDWLFAQLADAIALLGATSGAKSTPVASARSVSGQARR